MNLRQLDLGTPAAPVNGNSGTVALEIDGHRVSVPPGTSIMRAAMLADIPVPKLCATDSLEAFGSCRLCLVKVEGKNGFVYRASPGRYGSRHPGQ